MPAGVLWCVHSSTINRDDLLLAVNGGAWYGHSGSSVRVNRVGKWVVVGLIQGPAGYPNNPKCRARCVRWQEIHQFLDQFASGKKPMRTGRQIVPVLPMPKEEKSDGK